MQRLSQPIFPYVSMLPTQIVNVARQDTLSHCARLLQPILCSRFQSGFVKDGILDGAHLIAWLRAREEPNSATTAQHYLTQYDETAKRVLALMYKWELKL